jgi:AraC family transcriptional activator of pobA
VKAIVPVHKIKTKEMLKAGFDLISLASQMKERTYDASTFHRHTFYELFYFTKSGGEHEIDFRKLPVKAHSVHFVAPGQIHHLKLKGGSGYVICFTEDFFSLPGSGVIAQQFPFFGFSAEPILQLSNDVSEVLNQQIQLLRQARTSSQELGYEITRGYLNLILLGLKQSAISHGILLPETDRRNIAGDFRRLVNENFLNNLSITQYASRLNVSPNYLNSLCRQVTGKTATQIINDRLLLEARRLLYSTDLSIKEVAFELNFDSPAYFTRFFKKQSGDTPALYRASLLKNR